MAGRRDGDDLPGDALLVAVVGRPHGVKGELRLVPTSGDPGRLLDLKTIWLVVEGEPARRHGVRRMRLQSEMALVELEGVADRDVAAALTHAEVWARQADLPRLTGGAFGLDELVGRELVNGDRPVGRITDVVSNAGRDYLEVSVGDRTVLVPAVKDWLVQMDAEGGRVVMRLPEGLLDV